MNQCSTCSLSRAGSPPSMSGLGLLLNFYSFLFTDNYKKQMECLSTGTILADVKKDDVLNKLYFNVHKKEENYMKMKNLITCLKSLYFCK